MNRFICECGYTLDFYQGEAASMLAAWEDHEKSHQDNLRYLASVFRDIFTQPMEHVSDEGRMNMAIAQLRISLTEQQLIEPSSGGR